MYSTVEIVINVFVKVLCSVEHVWCGQHLDLRLLFICVEVVIILRLCVCACCFAQCCKVKLSKSGGDSDEIWNYEGRSVNSLQNGTIPLIFTIGKIQNMFCREFNFELHRNFLEWCSFVTDLSNDRCRNVKTQQQDNSLKIKNNLSYLMPCLHVK